MHKHWLEVFKANYTDFTTIKRALLALFSTFGVPEELASDGPPFNSHAFTQFLKDWVINTTPKAMGETRRQSNLQNAYSRET